MVTFLSAWCSSSSASSPTASSSRRSSASTTVPPPAVAHPDGVDYVPMKTWRIFLVQLLNIAGLGPIYGALSGACWGPVVYLWIVFGTILGGGVTTSCPA